MNNNAVKISTCSGTYFDCVFIQFLLGFKLKLDGSFKLGAIISA
jgi:hypothetical protein